MVLRLLLQLALVAIVVDRNSIGSRGIRCQRTSRYGVFAKTNSHVTDAASLLTPYGLILEPIVLWLRSSECIISTCIAGRLLDTVAENEPPDQTTLLEASSETSIKLSFFVAAEEEDWLLIKILMTGSGYALWASHVIFKSCGLTQPIANVVLLGGEYMMRSLDLNSSV